MPLHILKLCVGVKTIEELARWQKERRAQQRKAGVKKPVTRHLTRMTPKRAEEIVGGGSLYWVMAGVIRCRQRILKIGPGVNHRGEKRCEIRLDPKIVKVLPRGFRAFQGWRYFDAKDAPPDLVTLGKDVADMPPKMAEELRELGLL
jgi:hypothetical protein